MTQQQLTGIGPFWGMPPWNWNSTATFANTSAADATGEMLAICGRVWTPNRGTKSVRKVGFRFGTITKAGGSALTVSLQNIAAGLSTLQPDGTQDETVAIANGDASFASNTWYQTGAFSADRSVAYGELLGVVVEYDGGGRLGADSITLSGLNSLGSSPFQLAGMTLNAGGWTNQQVIPNCILEFSDGTFGTLDGCWPASAMGTLTYKQDTAGADEYGIEFTVDVPCKVDGCWAIGNSASNLADFDFILYNGTTQIASVSVDAHQTTLTGTSRLFLATLAETTLSTGTTYRLTIQPTQTAANVNLLRFDVNAAGHFAAHAMGANCYQCERLNAGAFSTTTTRRPFMGLRISSFDDGAGSGTSAYVIGG